MEWNLATRFRIGHQIGKGNHGEIYIGEDMNVSPPEAAAIKLEELTCKDPQLYHEWKIYKMIGKKEGVPSIKWFGSEGEGDYICLVMDLLGPSLDKLFTFCEKGFTLKTVLMIADEMLQRLEFIHSKSLIHCNLKPENIAIGMGATKNLCYLIDFGRAKRFPACRREEEDSIPFLEDKGYFMGSVRYASINNHLYRKQSRRDDLESLGYVLMHFLRGNLPWQHLRSNSTSDSLHALALKQSTRKELCQGYPSEFQQYFDYCSALGFEDQPDYSHLRKIFRDLFNSQGFVDDGKYDWEIRHLEGLSIADLPPDGQLRQQLEEIEEEMQQESSKQQPHSSSTQLNNKENEKFDNKDEQKEENSSKDEAEGRRRYYYYRSYC